MLTPKVMDQTNSWVTSEEKFVACAFNAAMFMQLL